MNVGRIIPLIAQKSSPKTVKFSPAELECINRYHQITPLNNGINKKLKRGVDFLGGFLGMTITSPVVLLSLLAIKLDSKGPAIFKQQRIGRDGKLFTMYKMRTLYYKDYHEYRITSPDDKNITRVGKFLRKYSIDEFPQFYNILKGDMSIIGPRPMPKYEHDWCVAETPEFSARYCVKPGAKLDYNAKTVSNEERLATEKEYIKNWSVKKDIKTFLNIVRDVISGNNF